MTASYSLGTLRTGSYYLITGKCVYLDKCYQFQLKRILKVFSSKEIGKNSTLKPQAGMLKCDNDAPMFRSDKLYGRGLCLRDENGMVI